jgi:XamI restriction endonuclease
MSRPGRRSHLARTEWTHDQLNADRGTSEALFRRERLEEPLKVSNSSVNSVKRLNNDAAAKAETWRQDFGSTQVVPVAVLSGVYALHNLESAQQRGLTLYWAHRLDDLTRWIDQTRV